MSRVAASIAGFVSAIVMIVTLHACRVPPALRPSLGDAPTHERYTEALSEFGLDRVALGQDWLAAASSALTQPLVAGTPFAEKGHLPPERPTAVGYRLELTRGRRFAIDVAYETPEPGRLFIDLFEMREGQEPRRVGGAAPGQTRFDYDVRWTGPHVLRLQPELLRGGRYSVALRTLASYRFPLKDRSLSAVSSGFGDPRDGGSRDHHGIDIFAPKGTPVFAATDGYVRTDETPVGGRVIWQRDERVGRNLYYAHLDDWAVQTGARVRAGELIGYVGNTGNARSTPPHLHFGVYDRGPSDPAPYLYRDDPLPASITAPVAPLGDWMRVARVAVRLRPVHAQSEKGLALARDVEVRVMAARRGDYRVWLRDGTAGLLRPQDLRASDPKSGSEP